MNKQRGFPLLEIIVALVIFALSAMMVVTTIPSHSGADTFGQQLKSLVEYGSDRAVMDGNIVGLVMTSSEFELVTQVGNNGERHWAPLKSGRIATRGEFPEEMHVSLSSRTLAATLDDEPQIIFLPDGELSRFTLSLESLDKKQRFRVTSQGSVPVMVENDD
ncbi:GspH/FimT family pseudopilin [Enterobacter asburiae]|uniref:GspH/FimT family pseudopilin n=1 Tax=Enterobacter asburiae TaxID=61645 RepID=UPI001FFEC64E|nr:GspH/FimT family pseudopilin [Enterobacter asburiae]MCK2173828.1 GspH/FimT family pseudopilin [Enterobacter asburiae]MDU0846228.1 GspH/FimT family pseudopilin [Enterobacter asburiae]MDU0854850.1 GspH/FimT family pseudopilin [Enterobacter asburiae]